MNKQKIAKELVRVAKELLGANEVREYFDKFRDKMGKRTTVDTALGWIEGINLSKANELRLKKKIFDYLGVIGYSEPYKNGLKIVGFDKIEVYKILYKADESLHMDSTFSYVGLKSGGYKWIWVGLFGIVDEVADELEKYGIVKR